MEKRVKARAAWLSKAAEWSAKARAINFRTRFPGAAPETSGTVPSPLSVVVNGEGHRADVPGYLVGGKTGTAQVAKAGEKGYQDGLAIGTFVGYAPVNDPKFVLLVKIENPKDVQWAESSAAPLFGDVMKFLLDYAKVEPTETVKGNK